MLCEIFSATSQDLNAWVPKGTQSIGLTFKLRNLAKFENFIK